MGETKIKEKLTSLLAEAFNVKKENVKGDRTTDFIVRIGENESEWYYFELKSTDKSEPGGRKDKEKYFGAASLSQLIEAEKHPNHYYFILASQDNDNITYGFATPDELLSYLTGYYMHADFNIPETELQNTCTKEETFLDRCHMLQKGELPHTLSPKDNQNNDKINRLKEIIKTQSKTNT